MKKTTFNLKKSGLDKRAFYDGAKPAMMKARQFANCQKAKLDSGMEAQEAWESCLEEYQNASKKANWAMKYS